MSATRTQAEQVKDMLLSLYLVNRAAECRYLPAKKGVQKLHFLAQKEMRDKRIKGFNRKFFTYRFGPYSKTLQNDLNALQQLGFLTHTHKLTQRGKALLARYQTILSQPGNSKVISIIDEVVAKFRDHGLRSLVQLVYELQIIPTGYLPPMKMKIREMEPYVDLLDPSSEDGSEASFAIEEKELESLELSFFWTQEDIKKMKRHSDATFEELFADV